MPLTDLPQQFIGLFRKNPLIKLTKNSLDFIHTGELNELRLNSAKLKQQVKDNSIDIMKDFLKPLDAQFLEDDFDKLSTEVAKHEQSQLQRKDQLIEKFIKDFDVLKTAGKTLIEREKVFNKSKQQLIKDLEEVKKDDGKFIDKLANEHPQITSALKATMEQKIDQLHQTQLGQLNSISDDISTHIQKRRNYTQNDLLRFQQLNFLSQQSKEVQEAAWQATMQPSAGTQLEVNKSALEKFAETIKLQDVPKLTVSEGFEVHQMGGRSSFTIELGFWGRVLGSGMASDYAIEKTLTTLSNQLVTFGVPAGSPPHNKTLSMDITLPLGESQQEAAESEKAAITSLREQFKHACINHGYDPNNVRCSVNGKDVAGGHFKNDIKFMNEIHEQRQQAQSHIKEYEQKSGYKP